MMMSKASKVTFGVVGALVVLTAVYFRGHGTPPGQPPLTVLNQTNLSEFRASFDAADGKPRLVLLLSPT
jgi:hypothetical protein